MYSKKQLKAVYAALNGTENVVEEICTTDLLAFEENTIREIWRNLNDACLQVIEMLKEEDRPDV